MKDKLSHEKFLSIIVSILSIVVSIFYGLPNYQLWPDSQAQIDTTNLPVIQLPQKTETSSYRVRDIDDIDWDILNNQSKTYQILAVVNGEIITNYDLKQYITFNDIFNKLTQKARLKNKEGKPNDLLRNLSNLQQDNEKPHDKKSKIKDSLNNLIIDFIKITMAEKTYGLKLKQKNIDMHLQNITQSLKITVQELQDIFTKNNISKANVNRFVSVLIIWEVIKYNFIAPNIKISQKQIKDTMQVMASNYGKPEYLVAELFIKKDPNVTRENINKTKQSIQEIHQISQTGEVPFSELILKYSSSPSRNLGGLIGWLNKNDLIKNNIIKNPEVKVAKDYISDIIETDQGFYIYNILYERTIPDPSNAFNILYLSLQNQNTDTNLKQIEDIKSTITNCDQMHDLAKKYPDKITLGNMQKIDKNKFPKILKEKFPADIQVGVMSEPVMVDKEIRLFIVCSLAESALTQQINKQIAQELKQKIINLRLDEFLKIMILNSQIQLKF